LVRPIDFSPPADVKVKIEFSVSNVTNFSDASVIGGEESPANGKTVFVFVTVCEELIDGALVLVLLFGC